MSALASAFAYPASRGFEPVDGAVRAPLPTQPYRPAAMAVRTGPSVIDMLAVHRADGTIDFKWDYIGVAAAALLSCPPRQVLGRCMSEGSAGAFDHPALLRRYRLVIERGAPQDFEQVHRVLGRQHLFMHRVVPTGEGVAVTLIDLSALHHTARTRPQAVVSHLCE